jgi:hypothetical protein
VATARKCELIEEALDEVAFAVEREIAQPLGLAIGLGRDDRGDCPLGEDADERVCVISLVAIRVSSALLRE